MEEDEEEKKEEEEGKEEGKDEKRRKKLEKVKDMVIKEERKLLELTNQIYNPEFLYRLLQLLYKCTAMGLDQVSIVIGNPKYLGILYSLLKTAPPHHKIMILKILGSILPTLPPELFNDSMKSARADLLNTPPPSSTTVLPHFLFEVLVSIRERCFGENSDFQFDYAVSSEIITLLRLLLSTSSWAPIVLEYVQKHVISEHVDSLKRKDGGIVGKALGLVLGVEVLGGEVNGLRFGGQVRLSQGSSEDLFNDNVLLKINLGDKLEGRREIGRIVGFSEDYREKLNEEDRKKVKGDADDPRFNIKTSLGATIDNRNPVVMVYSSLAKEITNLSTIELSTVNRFNVVGIDDKELEPFKNGEVIKELRSLYETVLQQSSEKVIESREVLLRAVTLKSFYHNLGKNKEYLEEVCCNEEMVANLVKLANMQVITGDNLMNLELTEEKLHRLLTLSAETQLDLSDLKNLSITVKNYEIEIQLGKDFSTRKFPIQAGYNLEKVSQYFEVIPLNIAKFLERKELANKAVVIAFGEFLEENYDIINSSRLIITHGIELQKLDLANKKGLPPLPSSSSSPPPLTLKKKKSSAREDRRDSNPQYKRAKSKLGKLNPSCLIIVSERYFSEIISEYDSQKRKNYKNIYEEKKLVEELIEFGFPEEVVQDYIFENGAGNIEIMINDISKIIEQREEEKARQSSSEPEKALEVVKKEAGVRKEEEEEEKTEDGGEGEREGIVDVVGENEKKEGERRREEEEEAEEQEEKEEIEDVEKEEANSCFKCRGEKEIGGLSEEKNRLYDSLVDVEGSNRIGKIILFKQTSHNLTIYYARRALLLLLESSATLPLLPTQSLLRFIKLLSFEAIFSSSVFCDSALLIRLRTFLLSLFKRANDNPKLVPIIDILFQNTVLNPLSELESKYLGSKREEGRREGLRKDELGKKEEESLKSTDVKPIKEELNKKLIEKGDGPINKEEKKDGKKEGKKEGKKSEEDEYAKKLAEKAAYAKPSQPILKKEEIKSNTISENNKPNSNLNKGQVSSQEEGRKEDGGERRKEGEGPKWAFNGKLNNESEIDKPFLDFSLWMAQTFCSCGVAEVEAKMVRTDVLFSVIGLVTVIRQNKSLIWGVMTFLMDYIEFLKRNLALLLSSSSFHLYSSSHVLRLHSYLHLLKSKEKSESHSKKTQMLAEVLLNLNVLHRSLEKYEKPLEKPESLDHKGNANEIMEKLRGGTEEEGGRKRVMGVSESRLDLEKFKLVENMTDVVEMMENYNESKALIAGTWLQSANELVRKEQKVIDGEHFYWKNLHTFRVNMPFTSETTIKFSEDSMTDLGDSMIFSSDPRGELSIQKVGGVLSKKTINFPAGTFYVHFPAKGIKQNKN